MPAYTTLFIALLCLPVALSAGEFVRDDIISNPTHERFTVCYNNSCKSIAELSLTKAEWQHLTANWSQPAVDAAAERKRIRQYIAAMEQVVGPETGTQHDLPGVFRGLFKPGQMDCIDEATNTTSYLRLLEHEGLLHFHQVESPRTRFVLPVSWPHTAALIRDIRSDQLFIVDSWFEANGQPPHIIELSAWKQGWKPAEETSHD